MGSFAGDGERKLEAPGFATYRRRFRKSLRVALFLVKLLIGTMFDVFIDSSRIHSSAPKSTGLVEALWRRRERVPVPYAAGRNGPL